MRAPSPRSMPSPVPSRRRRPSPSAGTGPLPRRCILRASSRSRPRPHRHGRRPARTPPPGGETRMKVVTPRAGYGTRLRPHTWSKPKPLVTVAGKPLLGHVLDTVAGLPFVDEVIFTVGYLGQQVEEYVRQEYPGGGGRRH